MSVRLSVILPVFNGHPYLRYQLQALADQICSFEWETIVVDNGSTDSSAATARSFSDRIPRLEVILEERHGKSHALNTGIAAASGDNLVFIDADDEIAPGYLEAMIAGLEIAEMVGGCMDTTLLNHLSAQGGGHRTDGLTGFLDWHVFVGGGLLGVRSATQEKIGEFDTSLRSAEDVDFTWRARLLGVRAEFAKNAVLHVRRPVSRWDAFLKGRSYGRSHVQLYLRFRAKGQPRRSLRAVLRHVRVIILPLLRRDNNGLWMSALEGGVLIGRVEESLRRKVLYL